MKRLLPVFNHTKNVNRFIQPLSFSMNRQIGTKQHLFVGTKSSEFAVNKLIKRNPTAIPTKNPEELHRAALEKTISRNVAAGRKTVDLQTIRPAVPSFATVPEAWVRNFKQEYTALIRLNPYFFDCKPRKDIIHQMVVWQLAKRRQGTHKTKHRRELAYTKKKMYAQKGTGRARHSDRGAPIFRGGGHTFPKRPRDYSFKLNKKFRRLALRMALTAKYQQGKLVILEDFKVLDENGAESLKTKAVKQAITTLLPQSSSYLFIDGQQVTESFQKGSFNLRNVDHLNVKGLNVYDMLRRETLVLSRASIDYLNSKYEKQIELQE